jgi:2-iminobutanoate/2-iminopropanoate deaminase
MATVRVLLTIVSAAVVLGAADKKPVMPAGAKPAGPYTPGIIAGETLYVAGQVGRDAKGNYPAEFEAEVAQTLESVKAIVEHAGYTLSDAVAVQVYMTDISMFDRMNAVYMKYFPEPRPARTTVGIAKLVGPARIEITVTAWKKQK